MIAVFARDSGRALAAVFLSALIAAATISAVPSLAEARGGRSYYTPSRGGTHAHYACEYGCSRRSRGTRIFGYRPRSVVDEHVGVLDRRLRRAPDEVLYPVAAGVGTGKGALVDITAPPRPACVHDRVPSPPLGSTYFSRPLRPFEIVGQPVAFADEVPNDQRSFILCE